MIGTMLGPYRVLEKLGEGGMGEVYKARDTRLDRDVAIKVVPADFTTDTDRLRRFEQEARTVGGLNHPNLVTLYDVGSTGSPQAAGGETIYLVMELLEGETLRERLAGKPLPVRRAIEIAQAIAEGLSAAHDKHIVHRDLKPENIFITRDGRVKVLDFGVAKLRTASAASDRGPNDLPTEPGRPAATHAGTVLGTAGYMSPEQVRGQPLDARSDLFALGTVLWEMLTGTPPFARPSTIETMHAIVREEPPEIDPTLKIPPVLERIVRTCLVKEPAARFHSAHDLAFALAALPSGSHPSLAVPSLGQRRSWRRAALVALALLIAAGLGAGAMWRLRGTVSPAVPSFRRLTFGRGTIDGARFVPGSGDIVYSARWQSSPSTMYLLREGSVEPRALDAHGAILLATSSQGSAAVMTAPTLDAGLFQGVISVLPLAGGGTREINRSGFGADFDADGADMCLVTQVRANTFQLEWPQGELVEKPTTNALRAPRVHEGTVAYFQARLAAIGDGEIRVASKGQRPRVLIQCKNFTSLAWGPDGREVWYSTFDGGESRFHAVSLQGQSRLLARFPGRVQLADVDSAGRALVVVNSELRQAFGRAPNAHAEAELTWLDAQMPVALQPDGSQVLLARATDWEMADQASIYLRPMDGGAATKLPMGSLAADLSRDGQWVATLTTGPNGRVGIRLIPTKAGVPQWYPLRTAVTTNALWFHPSGRSIYIPEEETSAVSRLDLATGTITPRVIPGQVGYTIGLAPFSTDGARMLVLDFGDQDLGDRPFAYEVLEADGGKPIRAKGYSRTEVATGWTDNNREAYLYDRNALPANVFKWDPITGSRRPFLRITPADPSGVWGISTLTITPSGNAYAYSVLRRLSDLYLIEGLK